MSETSTDKHEELVEVPAHEKTLLSLMELVPNKDDSIVINGWRITNYGTYYELGTVSEY